MKLGETRQEIPIFVGSTSTDLKEYRQAAFHALDQLETIVSGMEYFGSRPGTPIEESLQAVRTCKIFVGIFGMRYGFIPEGEEFSITRLEYNEAKKLGIRCLIYIIDEDNQKMLAKHVETGDGAKKLKEFKENLVKSHVVSFFTTPEDLAAKILHDIPIILEDIGVEIVDKLDVTGEVDASGLLRQFDLLPKLFRGRELTIEFINGEGFNSPRTEVCAALELELGATVYDYLKLLTGEPYYIYGENDIALEVCKLPKKAKVTARVVTVFGVEKGIDWGEEESITTHHEVSGLLIKEILRVNTAEK